MKKIAGTLKIAQAQFRELESFTKFGGDIDPVTAAVIDRGRKNQRILVQPQYHPWPVENEVAVIYCGVNGLLENVPMEKVGEFQEQLLQSLKMGDNKVVLDTLREGKLTPEVEEKLKAAAKEVADRIAALND
jgi:F-type H+-transporting ATPase subunit alpha